MRKRFSVGGSSHQILTYLFALIAFASGASLLCSARAETTSDAEACIPILDLQNFRQRCQSLTDESRPSSIAVDAEVVVDPNGSPKVETFPAITVPQYVLSLTCVTDPKTPNLVHSYLVGLPNDRDDVKLVLATLDPNNFHLLIDAPTPIPSMLLVPGIPTSTSLERTTLPINALPLATPTDEVFALEMASLAPTPEPTPTLETTSSPSPTPTETRVAVLSVFDNVCEWIRVSTPTPTPSPAITPTPAETGTPIPSSTPEIPRTTPTMLPTVAGTVAPTRSPPRGITPTPSPTPFHWIFAAGKYRPGDLKSGKEASDICKKVAADNNLMSSGWLAVLQDDLNHLDNINVRWDVFNVHCDPNSPAGQCRKPPVPDEQKFVSSSGRRAFFDAHERAIEDPRGQPIEPMSNNFLYAVTGIQPVVAPENKHCDWWTSLKAGDVTYVGNVRDRVNWASGWSYNFQLREDVPWTGPCDQQVAYIYCIDEQDISSELRVNYLKFGGAEALEFPHSSSFSDMKVEIVSPDGSSSTHIVPQKGYLHMRIKPGAKVTSTIKVILPPNETDKQIIQSELKMSHCIARNDSESVHSALLVFNEKGERDDPKLKELSIPNVKSVDAGSEAIVTCETTAVPGGVNLIVGELTPAEDYAFYEGEEKDPLASRLTREEPNYTTAEGASLPISLYSPGANQRQVEDAFAEILNAKRALLASKVPPIVFKPDINPNLSRPNFVPVSCPANYRFATRDELALRGPDGFKVRALGLAAIAITYGDEYVYRLIADDLRKPYAQRSAVVSFVNAPNMAETTRPYPANSPDDYPLSYDGDLGKIGTTWRVCFSMLATPTFTRDALENMFVWMLDSEPNLSKLKNPEICDTALRQLAGGQGINFSPNHQTLTQDWRRFYLNLVIEFNGGQCDASLADLVPANEFTLFVNNVYTQLQFRDDELTPDALMKKLTLVDATASSEPLPPISPPQYLQMRFLQRVFSAPNLEAPQNLADFAAKLDERLKKLTVRSLEYANAQRTAISGTDCNSLRSELSWFNYRWCKYNFVFGMLPIVGPLQDGYVFYGNVVSGYGPTLEKPSYAFDAAMLALNALPVVGKIMSREIYGASRAGRMTGSPEVTTAITKAVAKGASETAEEAQEVLRLYGSLVTRSRIPTAAETLVHEANDAAVAYGKLERALQDSMLQPMFRQGPAFHLPDTLVDLRFIADGSGKLPQSAIREFEKKLGVVLDEVPDAVDSSAVMYIVRGNDVSFLGRKALNVEKVGWNMVFSVERGAQNALETKEVVLPFLTNFLLSKTKNFREFIETMTFRHEYLHFYVNKLIQKGVLSPLSLQFHGLSTVRFAGGLRGYGNYMAAHEIRATGASIISMLRYAGKPKLTSAEASAVNAEMQSFIHLLGNMLEANAAHLSAAAKSTAKGYTKEMFERLPAATRDAEFGFLAKVAKTLYDENPSVVLALASGGKGKSLLPVGFHTAADGLKLDAGKMIEAYRAQMASARFGYTKALMKFETLVPEIPRGSLPPKDALFYRYGGESQNQLILVNEFAGPEARMYAQRQLRSLLREINSRF